MLHATHALTSAVESEHRGIRFSAPTVELAKLRAWKDSILAKLSGGVAQLAKIRGVEVCQRTRLFRRFHHTPR